MKQSEIFKPENERKYILKNLPDMPHWQDKIFIEQFYVPTDEGKNKRVRYTYNLKHGSGFGKLRGIECIIKENIGVGQNLEHIFEVTLEEAQELIGKAIKKISKTRHVYTFNNQKFEVDLFTGLSLVMMEVELDNINDHVIVPPSIQREIILDVTELPGNPFSNFNLAYPL